MNAICIIVRIPGHVQILGHLPYRVNCLCIFKNKFLLFKYNLYMLLTIF